MCADFAPVVEAFRTRLLTGEHSYVWLDATYLEVRIYGRVVSQATVLAMASSEHEPAWVLWETRLRVFQEPADDALPVRRLISVHTEP